MNEYGCEHCGTVTEETALTMVTIDGWPWELCPACVPAERDDRIAVRVFRGRVQFRAYPNGVKHADGGAGPWVEDRERAEGIHAAALADITGELIPA